MKTISEAKIQQAIATIQDPNSGENLDAAQLLSNYTIDKEDTLSIELTFPYPVESWQPRLTEILTAALQSDFPGEIQVQIHCKVTARSVQKGVSLLAGVKNTIAVASGKGGVGKSTTAVNLALALQAEGARAGILDADIYGPSQPRMLGCQGKPETRDGKSILPMTGHGIQNMSIGYMIEEDTPMIWRGPMVTSALEQLLRDTEWDDLDYLIIDLPPGTGDIQLTLCQKIPLSGVIIVTTPQDIALIDAKKAHRMFDKVAVPVLGIVENMSTHVCSQCGHEEAIFGSGGGAAMAAQYGTRLLGSLPLELAIRDGADNGNPTMISAPDSAAADAYRRIACQMAAQLALQAKDYSTLFPKITVENN